MSLPEDLAGPEDFAGAVAGEVSVAFFGAFDERRLRVLFGDLPSMARSESSSVETVEGLEFTSIG
jgi:hypothetical protein